MVLRNRIAIAVASLVWLIWRSGTQPRRLAYPCQQAAAFNLGAFLAGLIPVAFLAKREKNGRWLPQATIVRRQIAIGCIMFVTGLATFEVYQFANPVAPQPQSATNGTGVPTTVSIVKDYDGVYTDAQLRQMVRDAVSLAGGLGPVMVDQRGGGSAPWNTPNGTIDVMILPNMTGTQPGLPTDPRVTRAVVELAWEAGANSVKLGGAATGNNWTAFTQQGYDVNGDHYLDSDPRVPLIDLNNTGTTGACMAQIQYNNVTYISLPTSGAGAGVGRTGYYVHNELLKTDVMIVVPCIKNHDKGTITMSLKMRIGTAPQDIYFAPWLTCASTPFLRWEMHNYAGSGYTSKFPFNIGSTPTSEPEAVQRSLVDLNLVRPHDFTVIDALVGCESGPTTYDEPSVRVRSIMAGRDSLAIDTIGALVMGYNPDLIPCLNMANDSQVLGVKDRRLITVVGDHVKDVRVDFSLSWPTGYATPYRAESTNPVLGNISLTEGQTVPPNAVTVVSCSGVSDNILAIKAELFIDGVLNQVVTEPNPFSFNWNTTGLSAGAHQVKVTVYDAAMNEASITRNVIVGTTTNYTLTTSTGSGGTVTTPGIGSYQYASGTNASIVATANSGYHFVNWTGTAVTAGKVANTTSASTTVLMDSNYTVQANFAADTVNYTLTTATTAGGTVTTPGVGSYQYASGTVVNLVATANSGYHFVNWTGDAVANSTAASTTITMNGNKSVTANFAADVVNLLTNGGFENGPTGWTQWANNEWGSGNTWNFFSTEAGRIGNACLNLRIASGQKSFGVYQQVTVTPGRQYKVDAYWKGIKYAADNWYEVLLLNGPFDLVQADTGDFNTVLKPNLMYGYDSHTLPIPGNFGWIYVSNPANPTGFDPNNYGGVRTATGTIMTVVLKAGACCTANAADLWVDDVSLVDVTSPTNYTLTTATTTGGTVTTPGVGSYQYASGTVVNLVATANSGYHFVNWTGDAVANSSSASTTITMNGNKSVTANFAADAVNYTLTTATTAGGTVTTPGVGSYQYASGTVVNLVATANSGYHFVSWTGDAVANSTSASTTITMNANKSVTANFAADTVNYTLTTATTAGGTVTTPGVGSYQYASGTVVSLVATPNTGYVFVNWTGDAVANSTSASTTITMNANKSVTANFAVDPSGLCSNNRVNNPQFTSGETGWTRWIERGSATYSFTDTAGLPSGGSGTCARVTSTSFNGGFYQSMSLVSGQSYTVKILARDVNSTYASSNGPWAEVLVGTQQPTNSSDYTAGNPSGTTLLLKWDTTTCDNWNGNENTACKTKVLSFTAPAATAYLVLKCGQTSTHTVDISWDDVQICGPAPVTCGAPSAVCKNLTRALGSNGQVTVNATEVNNNSTPGSGGCTLSGYLIKKNSGGSFASSITFSSSELGANGVTLQVTQSDGQTATCTATVTVTNSPPVIAQGDVASITVTQNSTCPASSNQLSLSATDPESQALSWSVQTSPTKGAVTFVGGSSGSNVTVCYAPNAGISGTDSFVVRVSDGYGGTDSITVNVTVNLLGPAPAITSAKSIKVHGATEYGIDLGVSPAIGDVECRSGGPTRIDVTFDTSIVAANGAFNAGDEASVAAPASITDLTVVSGNILRITLSGVQNRSCLKVTLKGIARNAGGYAGAVMADTIIQQRCLIGDTTNNGVVTSADINQTKAGIGAALSSSNFRRDVNGNGSISSTDVNLVKASVNNIPVSCP